MQPVHVVPPGIGKLAPGERRQARIVRVEIERGGPPTQTTRVIFHYALEDADTAAQTAEEAAITAGYG